MAPRTPDVALLEDTVAARIFDAMRVASARLGIERDAIRADVARSPELVEKWDRAVAGAWHEDE